MDTGTIVLLVFFFIVLGVGGFFGYRYFVPASAAASTGPGFGAGIYTAFSTFMIYTPTAILTFGFIADMLAQQYNMSAGSFVGIAAVLLNWGLGRAMGVKPAPSAAPDDGPVFGPDLPPGGLSNYNIPGNPFLGGKRQRGGAAVLADICNNIPGLNLSGYFSQPILMTATILMFYLNGMYANNPTHALSGSIFTYTFILLQAFFVWKHCALAGTNKLDWKQVVGAIFVGLALGTVGYWINDAIFPNKTPGSYGPNAPMYGGTQSTPGVGTCAPPNDQDQFVCEAYKNGELISSTITS